MKPRQQPKPQQEKLSTQPRRTAKSLLRRLLTQKIQTKSHLKNPLLTRRNLTMKLSLLLKLGEPLSTLIVKQKPQPRPQQEKLSTQPRDSNRKLSSTELLLLR